MTREDALEILDLNLKGRYRGNSDRLRLAVEIATGDVEEGAEECETWWGAIEIGGEG